jgi:hypothetical protein
MQFNLELAVAKYLMTSEAPVIVRRNIDGMLHALAERLRRSA